MPTCLAIFAHPDDLEFVAAGTLLLLGRRGWDLHVIHLCNGNCGSVEMDAPTTARKRLEEAREAARLLGSRHHPPIANDMELAYTTPLLRKVAAVVREVRADVVLTHSPVDYMEDHTNACRLAVSAAFAHGIPNFETDPPREAYGHDVAVYHAMPHGLCDPLRRPIRPEAFVDTSSVQDEKRAALAAHESQRGWLNVSQGMDSYLVSMDEMAREVGRMSGVFDYAEGWRRHLHLGFSGRDIDPLRDALGAFYRWNQNLEAAR
jgi:LmbE family N-acetylglucosaminyl deacetylase